METASINASASARTERGCHLVLVLQQELVVLALCHSVQLDSDVGQEGRGVSSDSRSAYSASNGA